MFFSSMFVLCSCYLYINQNFHLACKMNYHWSSPDDILLQIIIRFSPMMYHWGTNDITITNDIITQSKYHSPKYHEPMIFCLMIIQWYLTVRARFHWPTWRLTLWPISCFYRMIPLRLRKWMGEVNLYNHRFQFWRLVV